MLSIITVTLPSLLLFFCTDLVITSQIARHRGEVAKQERDTGGTMMEIKHGRDTGGTMMQTKPKLVHRLKEWGTKQEYNDMLKYTQRKELIRKKLNKIRNSKKHQKKEMKKKKQRIREKTSKKRSRKKIRTKKRRRKKNKKKKKRHPRDELVFDTSCECGVTKNQRIVNGVEAEPGRWPWMVTLEDGGSYYCGGSIISSRYVLTAAHCISFKGQKVFVVIGDHDKLDDSEAVTERIKGRAIPHKDYDPNTMDNDVAVIRLNKEIIFSSWPGTVSPVCLARKKDGDYPDTDVTATGWGTLWSGGPQASLLMEVSLRTITNTQCGEDYGYSKSDITDSMLCTVMPGKDACQGDSGGPLVTMDQERGRYVQLGVVSWGLGCAEKDYPGVFARVTRLERWILNKARKSGKFCSEG